VLKGLIVESGLTVILLGDILVSHSGIAETSSSLGFFAL
jgi:hypothetical protein